jgi:hypothetical protein
MQCSNCTYINAVAQFKFADISGIYGSLGRTALLRTTQKSLYSIAEVTGFCHLTLHGFWVALLDAFECLCLRVLS